MYLVGISAMSADFCTRCRTTVKQENIHFSTKFCWNACETTKSCSFNHDNPHFSACEGHAELTACELSRGSLRRTSGPQTLQIWSWTRWTITSGAPCWKSTINSSRSLKRWWAESRPADHLGIAATRTRQQGGGELHQTLDCLHSYRCQWWSLRASTVTLSMSMSASSSHHQQTSSFQSHQQTTG